MPPKISEVEKLRRKNNELNRRLNEITKQLRALEKKATQQRDSSNLPPP